MTPEQLDQLFTDRHSLIVASGIERSEQEAFIPWSCLLAASANALDQVLPGWRAIENLAPVTTEGLETDEALQPAS